MKGSTVTNALYLNRALYKFISRSALLAPAACLSYLCMVRLIITTHCSRERASWRARSEAGVSEVNHARCRHGPATASRQKIRTQHSVTRGDSTPHSACVTVSVPSSTNTRPTTTSERGERGNDCTYRVRETHSEIPI